MFTTSHLLSQLKNASCPDFTQKLHVDITKKHKTSRELHVRLLFSCAISQCIIHKQLYNSCNLQQELSYRQQIARQLRTQYAKGICRHTFYTVKKVTQGHWKQNHWIDHTRLQSIHQKRIRVTKVTNVTVRQLSSS